MNKINNETFRFLVRYAREITSSPVSLRTVTGNVVIGVKEDIACKGGHKKETCSTYVREGRKAGGFSERVFFFFLRQKDSFTRIHTSRIII